METKNNLPNLDHALLGLGLLLLVSGITLSIAWYWQQLNVPFQCVILLSASLIIATLFFYYKKNENLLFLFSAGLSFTLAFTLELILREQFTIPNQTLFLGLWASFFLPFIFIKPNLKNYSFITILINLIILSFWKEFVIGNPRVDDLLFLFLIIINALFYYFSKNRLSQYSWLPLTFSLVSSWVPINNLIMILTFQHSIFAVSNLSMLLSGVAGIVAHWVFIHDSIRQKNLVHTALISLSVIILSSDLIANLFETIGFSISTTALILSLAIPISAFIISYHLLSHCEPTKNSSVLLKSFSYAAIILSFICFILFLIKLPLNISSSYWLIILGAISVIFGLAVDYLSVKFQENKNLLKTAIAQWLFLLGQFSFVYGGHLLLLENNLNTGWQIPFLLVFFNISLYFLFFNYIFRFLSSLIALISLSIGSFYILKTSVSLLIIYIACILTLIIFNNKKKFLQLWEPFILSLLIYLALVSIPLSCFMFTSISHSFSYWVIPPLVFNLFLGILISHILFQNTQLRRIQKGILLCGIMLLCVIGNNGLLSALLLMTVGYSRGIKFLVTLGMLLFVTFLIVYYYSFYVPLLTKAFSLMILGTILIIFYIFHRVRFQEPHIDRIDR